MKNLICLILCFWTCSIYAQGPNNDDDKKVLAYFSAFTLNEDDDSCGGGGSSVSDKQSCAIGNKQDDYLIKFYEGSSPNFTIPYFGNGPGEVTTYYELLKLDTDNGTYKFRIDIWESDDGNNDYNPGVDDDECGNSEVTINIFNSSPGKTNEYEIDCPSSTNSGTLSYIYHFMKGDDISNALNFTVISDGSTKSHTNRIVAPNNGIVPPDFEYVDELDNSDGDFLNSDPEVVYKFELTTCLNINLSTTLSSTEQPSIKLYKLSGNNISEHVSTILGDEVFDGNLYTGNYVAILEGDNDNEFTIQIVGETQLHYLEAKILSLLSFHKRGNPLKSKSCSKWFYLDYDH